MPLKYVQNVGLQCHVGEICGCVRNRYSLEGSRWLSKISTYLFHIPHTSVMHTDITYVQMTFVKDSEAASYHHKGWQHQSGRSFTSFVQCRQCKYKAMNKAWTGAIQMTSSWNVEVWKKKMPPLCIFPLCHMTKKLRINKEI